VERVLASRRSRKLFEAGDGAAGSILRQDQLESFARIDPFLKGDGNHRFHVLARHDPFDGRGYGRRVANSPVVWPRPGHIAVAQE
jgi:hypothetical protein